MNDPINRLMHELADQPNCRVVQIPDRWVRLVLEAVQWLKRDCPSIRLKRIERSGPVLVIDCEVHARDGQRAGEIVLEAMRTAYELDERPDVTREEVPWWASRIVTVGDERRS